MKRRSQARMLAMQALCLFDAMGDTFLDRLNDFLRDEQYYDDLGIEGPLENETLGFARSLAQGAWSHRGRLDPLISRAVPRWSITRLAPVDRNILRLGLYEMFEAGGLPHAVVINEAVELARTFGNGDSPAFVNGILDAIRRENGEASQEGGSGDRETGELHPGAAGEMNEQQPGLS